MNVDAMDDFKAKLPELKPDECYTIWYGDTNSLGVSILKTEITRKHYEETPRVGDCEVINKPLESKEALAAEVEKHKAKYVEWWEHWTSRGYALKRPSFSIYLYSDEQKIKNKE